LSTGGIVVPTAPAAAPRPGTSAFERMRRWLLEPEYPLVALEVRPRSVGAVRAVRERGRPALAAAASLSLPEGTLGLSMAQPNIASPDVFRETVRSVFERAGIPLHGEVGLVLPDPVARVSLIASSDITSKDAGEIEEMIRFRMRKAVPFDIKEARVAFQLAPPGMPDAMAIAVVMARPVLEGYESVLASLGLQAGLVELTGLAILTSVEASRPPGDRLIVNWDEGYVSLLLTRGGDLVLARTLTGEGTSTQDDIVREVANTVLYYREKLGGAGLASVVLRSAVLPPAQAVDLLREPLGMTPEILDPWSTSGAGDVTPAGQAVAGAAASVVGKAL
jgi:type IV pilus assembly protein PilM